MAKLQSGDLNLEIVFNSFGDEWIAYEIKFFWKDDIIVNDNVLKRDSECVNNGVEFPTFNGLDFPTPL